MNLASTAILGGLSTGVRILAGLAINKIQAVYLGPVGLAVVGQFGGFVAATSGLASLGLPPAITRLVAQHRDANTFAPALATALCMMLGGFLVVSLAIVLSAGALADSLLGSRAFQWAFWLAVPTVLAIAVNNIVTAVLTGQKRVWAITGLGIGSTVFTLALALPLTIANGVEGALTAACLAPIAIAGLVAWYFLSGQPPGVRLHGSKPSARSLRPFLPYSVMAVTAAIAGPVSYLFVRDYIAKTVSWQGAGYWQAMIRTSEIYLTVITSSLSLYFLPRFAELSVKSELRREIWLAYRFVVPVAAAFGVLIYALRDWWIQVVFSKSFAPMADLVPLQLLGDCIKVSAWVLGNFMLAKGLMWSYVSTEIVFSALFPALSILFIDIYGLIGVTYAYTLNYLAYLLTLSFIVRRAITE